jgi:hypothetical protein
MSDSEDAILFHGLPVPDGNGRRMLYSSDHRVIYTYKLSSAELDQAFKMAVTSDGPDGLWKIKSDDRVMVRQRRQAHCCRRILFSSSLTRPELLRYPSRCACAQYAGKLEVQRDSVTLRVSLEDHPEAGMSALKYFTLKSAPP